MNNEQKYTNKVIEAINKGFELSKEKSLPCFDVPELLRVLFDQENSMYVLMKRKFHSSLPKPLMILLKLQQAMK